MSRFPPSFLDELRSRVSLSSVIGRFVAWDRRKTNAGRGDYWACCPLHGEKTPSFHVSDHNGFYNCFGCKASGDVFKFLAEKEGLAFPEAVERLAEQAGLLLPDRSPEDAAKDKQRTSLYDIMAMAQQFFVAELASDRGAPGRAYIEQRGIPSEVVTEFGIGYAPNDKAALRAFLADRGVPLERMAEAGLIVTGDDIPVAYDRFRDRVMFPIKDSRGRVIAFGGRALSKDAPAKYLNSPETLLFHKGSVLYNLDKARQSAHDTSKIIAVEGYLDVIAMHRANIPNAVAPLGTALTAEQLAALWKLAPEPVLCFDGDSAGQKAAYRALDMAVPLLKPGYSLRFVLLPDGQDPDDILRNHGVKALRSAISNPLPLADLLWERALGEFDRSTPERKARFEAAIYGHVESIADTQVRAHYRREMKDRTWKLFNPRSVKPAIAASRHSPSLLLASLTALEQKFAAQRQMQNEGCYDDVD